MEIIPAIDIRGGKCVQLVQGDYGRETVFGDDPVAMAHRWVTQGARRLHVVDLDGAKEGRPVNDALVRRIVRECGADVQVAGGVRDAGAIDQWAQAGAMRIVLGTLAVREPDAVSAAVRAHGERIAVAVDVKDGKPATEGWLGTGDGRADDFVRAMALREVRHFIYTDVSRDGMMQHIDFAALHAMLGVLIDTGTPAQMIYSGGVTAIADVVALAEHDLEGVIIGTALYDRSISLPDAIAALATGDGT
jgi:phosphoribosylformimino-5-aminoimidazole carboxamide ribotide isomerase